MPEPLSRGGEEFLLRVKGESMVDAGILDGDYVVVRRQQTAQDGDIVVALAGEDEAADEATVKRFFREAGRVRLQPENAAHGAALSRPRAGPRQGDRGVQAGLMEIVTLNRTLDQELSALMRGASLECLACGEFVLHDGGVIRCPQCGSGLRRAKEATLQLGLQAG